jgi:polar amino acid transport system substrate-binding protein
MNKSMKHTSVSMREGSIPMKRSRALYGLIVAGLTLCWMILWPTAIGGDEVGNSDTNGRPVLKIGYGDYPPVKYYKNGEHRGVVLEMIQSILEKEGYRVKFYMYPWNRVLNQTREGDLDLILCIAANEAPDLSRNKVVFQRVKYGIYVSKDNPWRYTGKESLAALGTLAILENYDYGDELMTTIKAHPEKFQIFTEDNTIARFAMMIKADRLAGFIEDINTTKFNLAGTGFEDSVQLAGIIESVNDAYVGFSPKLPPATVEKLTKTLDEGAKNFYRSDKFAELLKKEGIYDTYYPLFKDFTS